jgi:hypothetical protein
VQRITRHAVLQIEGSRMGEFFVLAFQANVVWLIRKRDGAGKDDTPTQKK